MSDQLPAGFEIDHSELPPGFEIEAASKKASQPYTDPRGSVGEAMMQFASSGLAAIPAGIAGLGTMAGNAMGLTDKSPADEVRDVQDFWTYQPRTQGGRDVAGAVAYPFEKLGAAGDYVGDQANAQGSQTPRISATAANYGVEPMQAADNRSQGERAMEGAVFNTAVQSLPSLLVKGKASGIAGDVSGSPILGRGFNSVPGAPRLPVAAAERPRGLAGVSEAAPTKEALTKAADAAYKRADESGVVVTPESFGGLKSKIVDQMERDGIDPTLHPDSTAALKRITDSDGSLSLQKLETLRRVANDAEGSIKPADRRLASKMVDEIDEYIDTLTEKDVVAGDAAKAGALKEARNLYSRKKKAEELDQLVSRAELSAPNFSGSGMENALRTEFRALAKNEKRMRRFTQEEQEAIKRVAKGGPTENILRMLGKFAPTGALSTGISMGAGFVGGGPIGAAALPAAGAAARYAATRMTLRNVASANELVRRGPLAPPPPGLLAPEEAAQPYGVLGR